MNILHFLIASFYITTHSNCQEYLNNDLELKYGNAYDKIDFNHVLDISEDLISQCQNLNCTFDMCCVVTGKLFAEVKTLECQSKRKLDEVCSRLPSALGPYIRYCPCQDDLQCVLNNFDFYERCVEAQTVPNLLPNHT